MSGAWLVGRRAVLALADNPLIKSVVTRYGMSLGASRFVAGETIEGAAEVVRSLNGAGMAATLDCLGESVTSMEEAGRATSAYLQLLDRIARDGLDANVSLKLTQLGLDIDRELCLDNLSAIVRSAAERANFVRIDMEDSAHTQRTIDVFRTVRASLGNVGLVIQAYLYRSERDVRELAEIGANLRLCKGAYNEPPTVAYRDRREVDANFRRLIEIQMGSGNYLAVATHDEAIIGFAADLAAARGLSRDRYEFQMLYGIRRDLQEALVREGYRLRVYVPFGTEWYAYFMRRLAERPANLAFAVRNFIRS